MKTDAEHAVANLDEVKRSLTELRFFRFLRRMMPCGGRCTGLFIRSLDLKSMRSRQ